VVCLQLRLIILLKQVSVSILRTQMRPILTDQVVWSVGLSVTLVSPARTAEPIMMPFWVRTWMGQGNHVLDAVQIPHGRDNFWVEKGFPL